MRRRHSRHLWEISVSARPLWTYLCRHPVASPSRSLLMCEYSPAPSANRAWSVSAAPYAIAPIQTYRSKERQKLIYLRLVAYLVVWTDFYLKVKLDYRFVNDSLTIASLLKFGSLLAGVGDALHLRVLSLHRAGSLLGILNWVYAVDAVRFVSICGVHFDLDFVITT